MTWPPVYTNRSTEAAQAPVYCLIVFEDRTQLGGDIGVAPSTVAGATGDSMTLRDRGGNPYPFMLYDNDGFELFTGEYDAGSNTFSNVSYGAYDTTARTFTRNRTNVAVPWLCLSTTSVNDLFQVGMSFPSGGRQEMDLIEGYTRSESVSVEVQDTNARITKQMT